MFPPAVPPEERKPIRVLGLFDGIATGRLFRGEWRRGERCVIRCFMFIFPFQVCLS